MQFTIELIDDTTTQNEKCLHEAEVYSGLLMELIINNVNNEKCSVVKAVEDTGSDVVEINICLYVENAAEILEKFKLVGNFEVLNK